MYYREAMTIMTCVSMWLPLLCRDTGAASGSRYQPTAAHIKWRLIQDGDDYPKKKNLGEKGEKKK